MASPKTSEPSYYPLPSHQHHQNYVVYHPAVSRRRQSRPRIICTAAILLLAAAVYFLWPSDPDLNIARLRLDRIHIHTVPTFAVDATLRLTVKIINVDFYSIDYSWLVVSIGYRGKTLGFVTSDRGHVRGMASSYVDATLELEGVEVLSDVIMLVEDLARGSVPFDTVTEVRGRLGVFFFELPLKARVSCEVRVNARNQTIIRQNCYNK
ncbi:Late embryogenesis abundant protein, LEA-14 protein, partial [Actinidia chinensis var. chinensis]